MRREYDYKANIDPLDKLYHAINDKFANGSNYIELAKKFDNSEYQWVMVRNRASSDTTGSSKTTGYFYVFNTNGECLASIDFSYSFVHRMAQTFITLSSINRSYMCVPQGAQVRYNYLDIYSFDPTTNTIKKEHTSTTQIGNFVDSRLFIDTFKSTQTGFYYYTNSNSTRQTPVGVTVSINTSTKAVSTTVNRTETSTRTINQMIYHNTTGRYYSYAWTYESATSTISFVTQTSTTGWSYSSTPLSPWANNYTGCVLFPIYYWNNDVASSNLAQVQKSLWWQTSGKFKRDRLLTSITTGAGPDVKCNPWWEMNQDTTYNASIYGLMTTDGIIIYTFNVSKMRLEKLNTEHEEIVA